MAAETGSATGSAVARDSKAGRFDPIDLLGRFAPVLFLIVLLVVFRSQEPNFATEQNFWFILRAELRLRHPRGRDDLRDPDRRDRPLGRLGRRLRRDRRGGGGQGKRLARCRQSGRRRQRSCSGRCWPRSAVGVGAGLIHGVRDRQVEGAGVRRHARRTRRLARRGAGPLRGQADQPLFGRLSLLGLASSSAGCRFRSCSSPRSSIVGYLVLALHDLWPLDLRGRRQSGGGPALRPQHDLVDHERLRHQRFLRRAVRIHALSRLGAAEVTAGRDTS